MRWGIVGPGRISRSFLAGLAASKDGRAVAVASRDLARADAVAREFGIPRAYGSYADLLVDGEVEAVYIGLPNSLHAEWAIAAARAGKHVLCEKPLAVSTAEAESMAEEARRHDVWLMEAFMYRFHPRTLKIRDLIDEGVIGQARLVRAFFGFLLTDPANVRLSAELAGGALMDVGCYCVNFARMVAGSPPTGVAASARWAASGVDETIVATVEYGAGAMAQIAGSFATHHHHTAEVIGTEGSIHVEHAFTPRSDRPSRLLVFRGQRYTDPEVLEFPPVDQYRLEAEGFGRLVAAGHSTRDLPQMPLAESLDNMATIDALYRSARVGHPERVER